MRTRLRIFGVVFGISVIALVARLFFWQVIKAGELTRQGQTQYQRSSSVNAKRGNILAVDGSALVADEKDWVVYAMKSELKDGYRTIANKLALLLVSDSADHDLLLAEAQRIEGVLGQKGVWLPIAHRVGNDVKKNIEALKIAGIGFDAEAARAYPEGSSSAHLLGFVGKDTDGADKGYFGLEGFYDLTLAGKPGFVNRESDAKGIPILFGNSKEINATQGVDLVTNIDKTVQLTVERELADGMELYGAKGGTVIVMNPQNGAILAMASVPSYDPAKYWEGSNDDFKDPAISDTFEPGSVFKPIVMASALDVGVIKPETICDICDGPVHVDKYEIDTWNKEYHPDSTMKDVIVNSDNVGMVFVGNKLGADKLYDYLDKFGLGKSTGIDLQGEVSVALRKKGSWNVVDLATTTFGQGIAITPIQMLRAIGVIANGGRIVKPEVVRQIKSGEWTSDIKPKIGEQVISKEAASDITQMMVAAVKAGEAKWAAPPGFKVAGKTGTAQIPIAGHYDPTKTIASFVGFAPADDPKFVMLVTLRQPSSSIWGSETAAPLWFNIAKDLFPYLGIQPEN